MALSDLIAAIQARAEASTNIVKQRLGAPVSGRDADWSQSDWLTTLLSGVYDWTSALAPGAHATQHKHLGGDEIATATPGANAIPKASAAGLLDSWISSAAAATLGLIKLTNHLGGTAALPTVIGVQETGGPTSLILGAWADGQFLKRVGATAVGAAAGGGSASEWMISNLYKQWAISTSAGAANRINTMGFVMPVGMDVSSITIHCASNGGGTDIVGFGIYDTAGNLLLRTDGYATTTGAPYDWAAVSKVVHYPVSGGPVTLQPGTYIWAWTSNGVSCSINASDAATANDYSGLDPYFGYSTTASAAGVLPATIALPVTYDPDRGRPWFGLKD